ncbi:uncharacterized protein LAJ45_04212 [Morchella importuna]|uniref:uncharacterized protein n=1 Tax=Morchella importuna TaxID=1174673 RepID=UPI001E8D3112|nr:uncharacterized protein LAJ45_04212 [Morchella importuna]KAH8151590.1 hypothetical protein LAJ45_04212 [Morchella importuna]
MSSSNPRGAVVVSPHDIWKKLEAYLLRLPVLTRIVMLLIAAFHFAATFGLPMAEYFALSPGKMDLGQMHRLNTYPLVHLGLLHAIFNLLALTPLLERFERECGTLKTLLLILGPLVTFPGFLYLGIEMFLLNGNTTVAGASALVFTLMAIESVKTYGFQPYYIIAGYEFPSYFTPVFWMVLMAFLMPGSSLLGHFCGLVIGYAYACRYLRLLEPSEWLMGKVEQKLSFIFSRVPHYVALDRRAELGYWEFMPMAGSFRSARGAVPTAAAAQSDMEDGFAGPGIRLGS